MAVEVNEKYGYAEIDIDETDIGISLRKKNDSYLFENTYTFYAEGMHDWKAAIALMQCAVMGLFDLAELQESGEK